MAMRYVAHVRLHARVLERFEAALVGRQLRGIRIVRTENPTNGHQCYTEHDAKEDEDEDREVGFGSRKVWPALSGMLSTAPAEAASCCPPQAPSRLSYGAALRTAGAAIQSMARGPAPDGRRSSVRGRDGLNRTIPQHALASALVILFGIQSAMTGQQA